MGTGDEPLASGRLNGSALPELQVPGTTAWDGMPGGRETYPLQVATLLRALLGGRTAPQRPPSTCTVPTVSALDLDAPPEAPVAADPCRITCASDQPHLTIDDAAATRLLEALGAPFDPDTFDPHDPAFLSDPFPTYARFREFAPIHHVPLYDSLWCFRAQDCRAILTATDIWYKHPPGGEPAPPGPMSALATLPAGLFSSDPPAHPQLRAAVKESLDRVLPQAPELAAKHAKQLLASIGASSRVEFVQDFALPLPAAVLFDLLGLADDPLLRQVLIGWQQAVASAHDITQSPGLRLQGATSAMALRTFFAGLVHAHRQAAPGAASGGLIGAVCDAFGARALGEPELEATLVDLLVAGYLSTTFLLATGVWRLLSSAPAALEQLRTAPQHISAAVEELLRLDGPVQVIDRYATSPTTLGDRQIAPGTRATAVVGSADRDLSVLQGPDEVRLDRGAGHMAFGAGIHTCVGAPLVRLVAPRALQTLLELTTVIELDGEPQWQTDPYLRAVVSLPLRLER